MSYFVICTLIMLNIVTWQSAMLTLFLNVTWQSAMMTRFLRSCGRLSAMMTQFTRSRGSHARCQTGFVFWKVRVSQGNGKKRGRHPHRRCALSYRCSPQSGLDQLVVDSLLDPREGKRPVALGQRCVEKVNAPGARRGCVSSAEMNHGGKICVNQESAKRKSRENPDDRSDSPSAKANSGNCLLEKWAATAVCLCVTVG